MAVPAAHPGIPISPSDDCRRRRKVCYGCRKKGHFLRNCPEKRLHERRLTHLVEVGTASTFLLEQDAVEHTEDHEKVLHFLDESNGTFTPEKDDSPDFDAWIVAMLDMYDSLTCTDQGKPSTPSGYHHINFSVPQLHSMLQELVLHASVPSSKLLVIDTGAPNTICSIDWLQQAQCNPSRRLIFQTTYIRSDSPDTQSMPFMALVS